VPELTTTRGTQIGEKTKELLRQLREGKISNEEVSQRLKEQVDAAIVTVVESQ